MLDRVAHRSALAGLRGWLTLGLAAFAVVVSLKVIRDPDYFTHLALGRAFVEAGTPRIHEPFLAPAAGEAPPPLFGALQLGPAGWPFQIALYGLWACCDHVGVSVAVALLAGLIAALLMALLPARWLSPTRVGFAAVLCGAAIMVARFRFTPRAELPAFALLAAACVAASRWRAGAGAAWFWGAGAAVAIWSTIHPSWTMGAVAVGALLVTGRSVSWWREWVAVRRWVVLPLAVAVSVAGWSAVRFAVSVLEQVRGGVFFAVTEMRPAWEFPELFGPYLALAAATLTVGWGERSGRWGRALVWGFSFLVGLLVVRNVAFSALTMMAPALEGLAGGATWEGEEKADRLAPGAAAIALILLTAVGVRDRDPPWGAGVDWPSFPRDAAAFVKDRALPEPVFNSWDVGGYLDFAWAGRPRTFLDGRLGSGAIVTDHDDLTEGIDPDRVLRTRGFRTLLVEPLYQNSGNLVPIVPRLLADPRWSLVRATDALVFVRAPPPPGLEPLDPTAGWLAVASLAAHYARVAPTAVAAPYIRAIALAQAGRIPESEAAWREAVQAHPELQARFTRR